MGGEGWAHITVRHGSGPAPTQVSCSAGPLTFDYETTRTEATPVVDGVKLEEPFQASAGPTTITRQHPFPGTPQAGLRSLTTQDGVVVACGAEWGEMEATISVSVEHELAELRERHVDCQLGTTVFKLAQD